MFFQKNIFDDLKLDRRLRVSRTTCLILLNLQHFHFIFHSSFFYYNFHWSCALTIRLSYHYFYLSIVFSFLEKSYKDENHWHWRRRRNRRSENQLSATFFKFVIEHSICWLHHKTTSINVVNSEDQNIDENRNRNEANEMKINSTLCFSNLLLSYADYIINLHR